MRHLIVGSGNMGKRHGAILESLGDEVKYVDLGYNLDRDGTYDAESVLICTPPETHADYVNHFKLTELPLFCEKPVSTDGLKLDYPGRSMVACNWRFCKCISRPTVIQSAYQSTDKVPFLDLIHFLDLFWLEHGRPVSAAGQRSNGTYTMHLTCESGCRMTVVLDTSADKPKTVVDGDPVHETPCDMFQKQMAVWRLVAKGITQSPNTVAELSLIHI